jgi:biopolymer transport protein ExbD
MLVLLIIFMVAAPLATVTVPVDLPPANAAPTPVQPTKPTIISIEKDGSIFVMEDHTDRAHLIEKITARLAQNHDERILLRADQTLQYRAIMDVMNMLQDAGYYKIGLVAEDTTPD